MTKIVKGYPPNFAEIRERFNPPPTAVYAYGDTIYSPSTADLPAHLVEHERVHFAQQAACGGPEAWWRRYIDDPRFRLEQEVEAYRAEWQHVQSLQRKERRELLAHFCRSLASRMYGGIVTKDQARRLITATLAAIAALALASAAAAAPKPNPSPAVVEQVIVAASKAARTKPSDAYVVGAKCRRPAGNRPRVYYCRVYAFDPSGKHGDLMCRYAEVVGPPFRVKRITDCASRHASPLPPA